MTPDQAAQAEDFFHVGWTAFDWAVVSVAGLWLAGWWLWRRVK